MHIGDFRAQCRRTFYNITGLLEAEGATWKDIVRTTCYLRDIERDYARVQRRAHGVLPGTGARSAAGLDRHSGQAVPSGPAGGNRSDRDVPQSRAATARTRMAPRLRSAMCGFSSPAVAAAAGGRNRTGPCSCGANPPGPPRRAHASPYANAPDDLRPFSQVHQALLRELHPDRRNITAPARDVPARRARGGRRSAHRLPRARSKITRTRPWAA